MSLTEYYEMLFQFQSTLKVFRTYNAFWKASVLIADSANSLITDVDEESERKAAAAWERLEAIHARLKSLHRVLNIPGPLIELPTDEWAEVVTPLSVQAQEQEEQKEHEGNGNA